MYDHSPVHYKKHSECFRIMFSIINCDINCTISQCLMRSGVRMDLKDNIYYLVYISYASSLCMYALCIISLTESLGDRAVLIPFDN